MAECITTILNRILGPHQKAYIPGRFISEATKNTYDIFEQAIRTKSPGLAILLDFEKAFDSVSFEFIQKSLEIFGLRKKFRKWINIILGNSNETAKFTGVSVVNGYPTDQFKILRGCRQGDPIAGYLFVLCIEILSLTIQNSRTIPYMTKQGNTNLNDTYADDLTLYLKYFPSDNKENKKNIKYVLDGFSIFF